MKTKSPLSAYILCGGKSSRMGTDKGFVRFRDRSFTDWCLEAARQITKDIHLVTANKKYAQFGYPLVEDIHKNKGPVGGIYTALENSATGWNLILSCDIPGITGSLLNHLFERTPEQTSIAFLSSGSNDYPLVAIYHKNCSKYFSEAIQENDLRLMNVIGKLNYERIEIPFSESHNLNNINTPEELEILKKTRYERYS
ncbi:molybdenum cofactor guanylyltransferase [Gramella jeungdoensis]|uniref:Probable molybdenum cofactor guanylyltransferase n=1 Tax=Gramella jeungdoensis TaxID=708091 RepID=A0ABT0Z1F4_9FLAO|nr:molybdenum cofactor guanylyltransferase [Gramella jeungdoensis]MCM8569100.1 molybdenum cofactor guanylyltransferase [Gramella jeungdoensis]